MAPVRRIEFPDEVDGSSLIVQWAEHPEARSEYLEAVRYLLIESGKLAAAQLEASREAAQRRINHWPDSMPPYLDLTTDPILRHTGLGKFNYRLIYQRREDRIWVLAYAHTSRMPGYWSNRLNDDPNFR